MHEAPRFMPGDLIRVIKAHHQIGRVDRVESNGRVCVRWEQNRLEWVSEHSIEFIPGFSPKRARP